MNVSKIVSNPKIVALSGNAFKGYCVLLVQSKKGVVENFTIKGLTRAWQENADLNLSTSKNTVKNIIRELEDSGLVKHNMDNKTLTFILDKE